MVVTNSAKQALRTKIKHILKSMDVENRANQSAIIAKKICSLPAFVNAQRISVYLNMENEVSTMEILSKMFEEKKQVFVPSYNGNEMEMLKINGLEDYNSLPMTKWNIKQPDIDASRQNAIDSGGLDLVLVPGVAFTKTGYRMGHGKGYYDRYLSKLLERCHKPTLVGLAFREQIIMDLPQLEHDVPLDIIVSPDD